MTYLATEAEKWLVRGLVKFLFGCSLTPLLGSAWVLLKYVLQTIFSGPVKPANILTLDLRIKSAISASDAIFVARQVSTDIFRALARIMCQLCGVCPFSKFRPKRWTDQSILRSA